MPISTNRSERVKWGHDDDVAVKVRVVFGLYIRLELRLNKNDS